MSDWDDEDQDVAVHFERFGDSTMAHEESLDPDAYDWRREPREDRDDQMADAVGYHVLEGIDDRPAWERGLTDLRCRRCELSSNSTRSEPARAAAEQTGAARGAGPTRSSTPQPRAVEPATATSIASERGVAV